MWLEFALNDDRKGEVGRGRWPVKPPKLSLVGVAIEGSSAMVVGCGCDRGIDGARGVVGVVTPNWCSWGPRPTLTDWKVVIVKETYGDILDVVTELSVWRHSRVRNILSGGVDGSAYD